MMGRATVIAASLTLLGGCMTDGETGTSSERTVAYTCDRGPPITVSYSEDVARIRTSDGTIEMKRRVSGSGAWYESPTHSVRDRGSEMVYTIGRMAPMVCHPEGATPR